MSLLRRFIHDTNRVSSRVAHMSEHGEPDGTTKAAKDAMRKSVLANCRFMPLERRATQSDEVCTRLRRMPDINRASVAMYYKADAFEVDVGPVIRKLWSRGTQVCVPRVDWASKRMSAALVTDFNRDLGPGKHGIWQPAAHCPEVSPEQIDVVLVPGIAFDSTCARLGRGAGFYDRFLADPRVRAVKIGVAFDEQIVDTVPMDRWDVRLDAVVTPTRVFERGPSSRQDADTRPRKV